MNKLEKILEIIEGRDWSHSNCKPKVLGYNLVFEVDDLNKVIWSIPDLLANQSFCKALWGKGAVEMKHIRQIEGLEITQEELDVYKRLLKKAWEHCSSEAFQILRDEGPDQALDYMIKTAHHE